MEKVLFLVVTSLASVDYGTQRGHSPGDPKGCAVHSGDGSSDTWVLVCIGPYVIIKDTG